MRYRQRMFDDRFHRGLPPHRSRRTAVWWDDGLSRPRMLTGHADQSKSKYGRLYRLRVRLYRRFCTRQAP